MSMSVAVCTLAVASASCLTWSGHQVKSGDLTVLIEDIPEVTELDKPVAVRVVLENGGDAGVSGTAEIRDLVDETRVVGDARKEFSLAARAKTTLEFAIAFGEGTYSALYPVHAYVDFEQGGKAMSAHAVRIVSTSFKKADRSSVEPTKMDVNVVPERGALPLWTLGTQRVAWRYYDGPMQYKEAGWTGSDEVCRATMSVQTITRGETKAAINMHPPWQPGGGTIFCDYLLKLPSTKPLRLTFANAIRDNTEKEPPSDGVLFRVWAAKGVAGEDAELLYENFTDAKTWAPGEADLSKYAGQTILLRLESNPGPNKDTTCDSSYWAEPTVIAGAEQKATGPSFAEAAAANAALGRRILSGKAKPNSATTFLIGKGNERVAVVFAPSPTGGIVEGALTLVGRKSAVSFDGFRVGIEGRQAVRWPTAMPPLSYRARKENGRAVHALTLQSNGESFDLTMTVWAERDGLRIAFASDKRITDFALGPADEEAPVVYYGHGYRIVNPRAFRAGFGGHNLSTSHVGCDFAGGMSLLQAVDVPPDYFEVEPSSKRYALHTHMNGTLTLVPSERGAFDCAIKYRPLYDKKPAGGVQRLAGRFCFDIWGGQYADIADRMQQMIRYGLTDSFLTVHVWQRWGYDYRLPDIWPPDPRFGTVEDMRKIGQVCGKRDIPWGLHDNYTDFYPDAEGYTYDDIRFTQDGRPIKAWYNTGRDAQSYGWRPDRFMPFLKRNLKLIKEGVAPTQYFIDVLTSIGCIDFYDREGNFHPSTESRQKWGEAFAWVRDYLGDDAPTTSEAGHDQLIGYLDGADCQHLTLTDTPRRFMLYVPCDDWERVPWFDAVNHSRFILHGVGYSSRYQGGRDRREHGINSDDYISAEALEGHALMVDAGSWGRPAVRKYWLAQSVARNLALKEITDVQMVDGDMHRLVVTWSNGTKVYVNRGESDWTVEGHVLPEYGYLAQGKGGLTSAIEKRDGIFCESSVGSGAWYCNARTYDPERRLRIEPRVENFEYLGEGRFSWDVVWNAGEPAPRDMTVFVHFYGDTTKRRDRICFQDDHRPEPPTSQWKGEVRYKRTITIPADARGEYVAALGIYDSSGRLRLTGQTPPEGIANAIWVGTLSVERENGKIANVSFTRPPPARPRPARANVAGKPVDFGFAITDGAFRAQKTESGLRVTPLPDSPAFEVTLKPGELGLKGKQVAEVLAVDDEGRESKAQFSQRGDAVTFKHDGKAFCYDVRL